MNGWSYYGPVSRLGGLTLATLLASTLPLAAQSSGLAVNPTVVVTPESFQLAGLNEGRPTPATQTAGRDGAGSSAGTRSPSEACGLDGPTGIRVAGDEVAGDRDEVALHWTVSENASPGTYSVHVRGEAVVPFRRHAAEKEPMDIVAAYPSTPSTVAVAPPPKQ
jgi:hypothetical protein